MKDSCNVAVLKDENKCVDREEFCGKALGVSQNLSYKVGLGGQNIYKTKVTKGPRQDSNVQPLIRSQMRYPLRH